MNLMLDTVIFNRVVEHKLEIEPVFDSSLIYMTEVQWKEICDTPAQYEDKKRAMIIEYLCLAPMVLKGNTATFATGNYWTDKRVKRLQCNAFLELQKYQKKDSSRGDATIITRCLVNDFLGLTLVTEDAGITRVIENYRQIIGDGPIDLWGRPTLELMSFERFKEEFGLVEKEQS